MHFMPNNNLEENISHFILIAPTKKNLPPKIAFQILGTQKLHLGNQVPGSRMFCCAGLGCYPTIGIIIKRVRLKS